MKRFIGLLGILVAMIGLSACGGLAGEPEVIGQVPQQPQVESQTDVLEPPNVAPDLEQGALIYAENCVRCHGEIGAGDGEFVQSGQITDIPNFTDPAQHEGRTAAEYYTQVTNGNLASLMPPFSGSLSDEERWSVANYVMTLAGDDVAIAVPEPVATEEVADEPDAGESETVDEPIGDVVFGTVSGVVIQGTAGATLSGIESAMLQIVDANGNRETMDTRVNADGSYEFVNVPIVVGGGYFVSVDYGNGTFHSEFARLTPESPDINLNVQVYETTDDPSVIQVNMVLTQIDLLDDNTLQLWQLINVTNTSDKVYVYTDNRGQSVSVQVPAPTGVRLSPDNDISRFVFNDNSIFDTRPVVPMQEHSFHLLYTAPIDNSFTFTQTLPYAFAGPYEAYVDKSVLKIQQNGWQVLDTQAVGNVTYSGIAQVSGFVADETIEYRITRSGLRINRQWIGYVVMSLGLVFIGIAAFVYWKSPAQPEAPTTDDPIQTLMKEIAELDDQFQQNQISQSQYDRQRKKLKDKLTSLMNATE